MRNRLSLDDNRSFRLALHLEAALMAPDRLRYAVDGGVVLAYVGGLEELARSSSVVAAVLPRDHDGFMGALSML